MTQRFRRRLGAAVGGIALGLLMINATAPQAWGVPAEAKRAEARQIAATIDQLSRRMSLLDEEFNLARLALSRAQSAVVTTAHAVATTEARYRTVRRQAQQRAVEAYVGGGRLGRIPALLGGDGTHLSLRQEYLRVTAGEDRAVLDELKASKDDLLGVRSRLEGKQAMAKRAESTAQARREAARQALAQQRRLLARVQGELAELVQTEEGRREAVATARARAELAARQAKEQTTLKPPGDAPAPLRGAAAAVEEAKRQVGKPYHYGGSGPGSFDCSGLTRWAWRAGGVSLPHSSRAQYAATTRVALSQIQPGDLLFYGNPIHHVGIYVGNGQMVEASQSGRPIRYRSIYRRDMVGVGRPG